MILPVTRDAETAGFFDGTLIGEFRLRRSRVTGEILGPQACVDSTGSTDLEWVAAAGTGKLVSWAVSYGKPVDGVQQVLSIVAIVELDEGPWWWTSLTGVSPESLREGLPVRVEFVRPEGSDEALPVFRA